MRFALEVEAGSLMTGPNLGPLRDSQMRLWARRAREKPASLQMLSEITFTLYTSGHAIAVAHDQANVSACFLMRPPPKQTSKQAAGTLRTTMAFKRVNSCSIRTFLRLQQAMVHEYGPNCWVHLGLEFEGSLNGS